MSLDELPIVLLLVGLVAYAVLAFADFGAGFWYLTFGDSARGRTMRDHAYHAMGPVWEANHVWLIFVLVIAWTSYPTAFGSVASTLAVPLFVAAIGIIGRGMAYAMRSQVATRREERLVGGTFAFSSVLTPFALGTVVGAIAARRVPVGNAAGDLVTSWFAPTPLLVGALAVVTGVYLAAVYLAADAARLHEPELIDPFRTRAIAAAVVAGALAVAGLLVVRHDVSALWHGLTHGLALAAVIVSAVAGVATVLLVLARRFELARASAALAVAAVVAGWAFAQRPLLLPGLDVHQAAAGHATLVAVVLAAGLGAIILGPSLALLFGLVLRGRLGGEGGQARQPDSLAAGVSAGAATAPVAGPGRGWLLVAVGLLIVGLAGALLDADWARVLEVVALFGFAAMAFLLLADTAD